MASPYLPLILSAKREDWRMHDPASMEADQGFKNVRPKILERDQNACRFCGFRAQKWQEVHHRNDDHRDNRPENLITACAFCHSVHHIGLAGHNGEAVLVWLPEIPQDRLHHIVRTIMVAERWAERAKVDAKPDPALLASSRDIAAAGRALQAKFRTREAEAQQLIGTSDPQELANILQAMDDRAYDNRADFLAGIRLLPLGKRVTEGNNVIPEWVDHWTMAAGGPYSNFKPQSWLGMLRSDTYKL